METADVTYFWRHKVPFERLKRELPRGVWGHAPPGNFKKEHSETLFPAFLDAKYQQLPSQDWSSLKFSLKVKYLMATAKWSGMGKGGWRQQNFQLFIIANLFLMEFKKKKDLR